MTDPGDGGPGDANAVAEGLATGLTTDGVVVLPAPLPTSFVAELRTAFLGLIERYDAGTDPNRGRRRHQMYLPFEPPFSDPALWGDPLVLAVLERLPAPRQAAAPPTGCLSRRLAWAVVDGVFHCG